MPRKSEFPNGFAIIGVQVTPEEKRMLERIARAEGISVSKLVRRYILRCLEEDRLRYGLRLLYDVEKVEAVADGASSSDPLSAEVVADFLSTLASVSRDVEWAAGEVEAIYSEVKGLEGISDDRVYVVQGRGHLRGSELKRELLYSLRQRFLRADRVLRLFFARVYYPWLHLRKEVTLREQVEIGQRVAALYRRVRMVRGKWMELREVFRHRGGAFSG